MKYYLIINNIMNENNLNNIGAPNLPQTTKPIQATPQLTVPQPVANIQQQRIDQVINNSDLQVEYTLNDSNNILDNKDKKFIKQLYEQYKDTILNGFSGKSVNDLNSTFWLNILVNLMISVENIKIQGMKKKDLVVETVCLVIRNDLPIGINEKAMVEGIFRKIGPGLVDTVIYASANLNISPESIKSCFSCCRSAKKK